VGKTQLDPGLDRVRRKIKGYLFYSKFSTLGLRPGFRLRMRRMNRGERVFALFGRPELGLGLLHPQTTHFFKGRWGYKQSLGIMHLQIPLEIRTPRRE
jgi:hypothetical protein